MMRYHVFAQSLAGWGMALGIIILLNQPSEGKIPQLKFSCGKSLDKPGISATFVFTSRSNIPIIYWVDNSFPKPWTPQKRCEEASARFQRFYENGMLDKLKGGWLHGQPVLCLTASKGGDCLPDGVLVTLKPGSDPNLILKRLLSFRILATTPIETAGGETDKKLIYEVNGETYVNLKIFLTQISNPE